MGEFLQTYGIWIALAAGMFLLHRLGIGCCAGHRHDRRRGHGNGDAATPEPKPADAKLPDEKKPEQVAATPPRPGSCH